MSLGPLFLILQVFFVVRLAFRSKIVIFEAFEHPFLTYLFEKGTSLGI